MKKQQFIIPLVMATSLSIISGCQSSEETTKTKATSQQKGNNEDHLNYKKQNDWEFETGDSQSPINIDLDKLQAMSDSGKLVLNYQNSILDEADNGHSIQLEAKGTANINGRNFELTQFHFHAKSEHTINGKHYPIEAHFVNKAQDGRIAVIGVFFIEGEKNEGFQKVLDNIKKGATNNSVGEINIGSMMPLNKSYYHYLGSLTTPPLSENVEWYVMKNPVEVSKEQIKAFTNNYNANNRKVQPLNRRVILEHKE
ncbi:carbonic anhydrase family protein [Bacillus sp. AFS088145]|uniref:carbonic anhydrase n=1 Tax=Bacillus sp. AFS088145 TaxID=2033514 RepID=UPI000BF54CDD|nr:carbonic anhydrase family protein [Bacillus sp. AFS088145]PFH84911.1 carbonic anhydrase [Bacillus sp. AFS088145]